MLGYIDHMLCVFISCFSSIHVCVYIVFSIRVYIVVFVQDDAFRRANRAHQELLHCSAQGECSIP